MTTTMKTMWSCWREKSNKLSDAVQRRQTFKINCWVDKYLLILIRDRNQEQLRVQKDPLLPEKEDGLSRLESLTDRKWIC